MNHTQANLHALQKPADTRSILDEIVREGAQHMLQRAIEQEVNAYIEAHQWCAMAISPNEKYSPVLVR